MAFLNVEKEKLMCIFSTNLVYKKPQTVTQFVNFRVDFFELFWFENVNQKFPFLNGKTFKKVPKKIAFFTLFAITNWNFFDDLKTLLVLSKFFDFFDIF